MKRRLPIWVLVLHYAIIGVLAVQLVYVGFVFWWVLAPDGMVAPLGTNAADVSLDLLVRRRLYALEAWVSFGTLAIYLALTEILPRMRQAGADPADG